MFKEIQKFRQLWLWIILGLAGTLILTIFGTGIYQQIYLGEKFGNHPMSDAGLMGTFGITLLIFTMLVALLSYAKLITIIDQEGIHYQFFPFHFQLRLIKWSSLTHWEVITYNPIREYGGWGIRYGSGGKAFNVSGDKGLQLLLKDGKKILIGTQKEMELTACLSGLKRLEV